MPLKQYKVKAPDGQMITLEGPEGASEQEVISQAQKLYRPKPATPPPAPAIGDPGMLANAGDFLKETGKGIIKGAASTVEGGGKLLRNTPVLGPLLSKGPEVTLPFSTKPSNTAQSIGKGAEQIGEFFVPGKAVSGAAKAVEGMMAARKAPAIVKGAVNLGAKVGLEAASAGSIAAAQAGDVNAGKDVGLAAAAIPVVGAAVKPVANVAKRVLSQKIAPRIVNSIIKPPKKEFRYGRDPGKEVAIQGLKSTTMDGLEKEIIERRERIGSHVDSILKSPKNAAKQIDIVPLVNAPIDDAIRTAKLDGNQGLVNRLEAFREGQFKERFGLPAIPKALRVNPFDTRKLKTEIGKGAKWSPDPIEGSLNQVRQQIYRNLNAAIDTAVPGTKALNGEYANLLGAAKSVEARKQALQSANFVGLSDAGVGIGFGMLAAAMSGELDAKSAASLILGTAISKGSRSPSMSILAAKLGKLTPGERTMLAERVVPVIRNLSFAAATEDQAESISR